MPRFHAMFVWLLAPVLLQAQAVLYVATGGGNLSTLYTVNPLTAQSTLVGDVLIDGITPITITALAVQPGTGTLFGVTGSEYTPSRQLLIINPLTGYATSLGTVGASRDQNASDMTFAANGTLYAWTTRGGPLATLNTASAARTTIGTATNGPGGNGLTFVPDGTLYLAGPTSSGNLYTVDTTTGVITSVAPLSNVPLNFGTYVNAMASDANGVIYATGRGSGAQLVTIDRVTGAMTTVGILSFGEADALAFSFAAIPEPSTWGLLGLGLGLVALAARRIG